MSRPVVSPASPDELAAVVRVLFGRRPDGDTRAGRCLEALAAGDHDPAGLLMARAGGRVCGAALVQALPGALGVAWPPCGESPGVEDALAVAGCDWLRSRGVKVCQAFAPADEVADMRPLERHGFRHVTRLVFMRHDGGRIPEPRFPLAFAADGPPFGHDFATALLATHEGTHDCPELNAGRTPAEILAGFEMPGGESYLAWHDDTPVGVVMLTGGADPGGVELSYLGVVPAARDRGYGSDLLAFAAAGAPLTLSVDARNEPALRLYRRHGFAETDSREVWLAHLVASVEA